MGYAVVKGGGADGRYTIELDFGSATHAAILASYTALITQIEAKILAQQLVLTEAEALEATQRAAVQLALDEYIERQGEAAAGGTPIGETDSAAWRFEYGKLVRLLAENQPIRTRLAAFRFELIAARKKAAELNQFIPTSTRQAWCADFTEDIPVGSTVGTIEIPGDSNLVLIKPGGPGWTASDGYLSGRELQSPEASFFNAAIFPGWQKWRPTYRWGIIATIDYGANTANVALHPQVSTAQGLAIDQEIVLAAVPIQYMTCNAEAFEVGDRVVVRFLGQVQGLPQIVGFVDNPRPCIAWPRVLIDVDVLDWDELTASTGVYVAWVDSITEVFCGLSTAIGYGRELGGPYDGISGTREWFTRYSNARFEDLLLADGFSLSVSLPPDYSWGETNFHPVSVEEDPFNRRAPAASPGVPALYVEAGIVKRKSLGYSFHTGSQWNYDPPPEGVGCIEVTGYDGNLWDGQPVGMTEAGYMATDPFAVEELGDWKTLSGAGTITVTVTHTASGQVKVYELTSEAGGFLYEAPP